ncbi:hypothetical protein K438DRAFT_1781275 [Mycena galopus ATCC 62051]|nr:hypothetical protein K438DRAFT_1781275 [Mycena galopus ATCC 62051]
MRLKYFHEHRVIIGHNHVLFVTLLPFACHTIATHMGDAAPWGPGAAAEPAMLSSTFSPFTTGATRIKIISECLQNKLYYGILETGTDPNSGQPYEIERTVLRSDITDPDVLAAWRAEMRRIASETPLVAVPGKAPLMKDRKRCKVHSSILFFWLTFFQVADFAGGGSPPKRVKHTVGTSAIIFNLGLIRVLSGDRIQFFPGGYTPAETSYAASPPHQVSTARVVPDASGAIPQCHEGDLPAEGQFSVRAMQHTASGPEFEQIAGLEPDGDHNNDSSCNSGISTNSQPTMSDPLENLRENQDPEVTPMRRKEYQQQPIRAYQMLDMTPMDDDFNHDTEVGAEPPLSFPTVLRAESPVIPEDSLISELPADCPECGDASFTNFKEHLLDLGMSPGHREVTIQVRYTTGKKRKSKTLGGRCARDNDSLEFHCTCDRKFWSKAGLLEHLSQEFAREEITHLRTKFQKKNPIRAAP